MNDPFRSIQTEHHDKQYEAMVHAASVMWRDHALTPSPNGGWPMAAMAGALECRISKAGVYSLNDGAAAPDAADIRRARRIATAAVLAGAAMLA